MTPGNASHFFRRIAAKSAAASNLNHARLALAPIGGVPCHSCGLLAPPVAVLAQVFELHTQQVRQLLQSGDLRLASAPICSVAPAAPGAHSTHAGTCPTAPGTHSAHAATCPPDSATACGSRPFGAFLSNLNELVMAGCYLVNC
jgi:hypothetical protein